MATASADPASPDHDDHGHGDHEHHPLLAHHFESAEQQFDSGKLGIWVFLITEVLFFSGLFVAYTVYRINHPEIFQYAHQFLDKTLGGLNTGVLIFSSLTMAWGVRCAQLGKKQGLMICLGLTLFCAALFLGVKTFEYGEKYHKQLLWQGTYFKEDPNVEDNPYLVNIVNREEAGAFKGTLDERVDATLATASMYWLIVCVVGGAGLGTGYWLKRNTLMVCGLAVLLSGVGLLIGTQGSLALHHARHSGESHSGESHSGESHSGESHSGESHDGEHAGEEHAEKAGDHHNEGDEVEGVPSAETDLEMATAAYGADPNEEHYGPKPRHANIFFSIYYFMTGLHAFHIIGGMIAISWLMVITMADKIQPEYFGPVDYVGLYWHLVDLIWIYLFPLLYLIGDTQV